MKFSNQVKKSVEERYYKLAAQNDMHFSNPRGPGSAGTEGSAGGAYRDTHREALVAAYGAGRKGDSIQPALVSEGMGQHFLTDSFASGHTSTPRTSISEYWNGKYPNFGQQFLNQIAHDVAEELANDATGLADAIPVSLIESKARAMILAKLGAKPLPKIGHIVALTIHATDNRDGLQVDNDRGWRWRAYGDHKLEPAEGVNAVAVPAELQIAGPACTMSNRNIAVTAVQLGIEEVKRAYALGKDSVQAPMANEAVLQYIRQHPTLLTQAGETYAPEQLVPDVDAARPDDGALNWMVADLAALWVTQIRTTKAETYGDFIANDMMPDGQMGGELDAIRAQLDETLNPMWDWVPKHGHLFPRRAFEKAVLQKLRNKDSCLAYLLQIINT